MNSANLFATLVRTNIPGSSSLQPEDIRAQILARFLARILAHSTLAPDCTTGAGRGPVLPGTSPLRGSPCRPLLAAKVQSSLNIYFPKTAVRNATRCSCVLHYRL